MDVFFQQYADQWMISASAVILILGAIAIVQGVKMHQLQRMIRDVLPESGKDFLSILDDQHKWNQGIDQRIQALADQDQRLLARINQAFQYRGMTTYSAFENGGRELSFSVAMVDAHLNGWVLSSLYAGAQGSSVYFKEIEKGRPKERLTPEEEKAVQQAISQKG